MMNIEKAQRRLSIMKTFNRKLTVLAGLLIMAACSNQPNLTQDRMQDAEAVKTAATPHFECHPSEYKFNTPPRLPPADPAAYPRYEPTHFEAVKRLPIPMNKELIVPKLQELGFIEKSNNEIVEKNFGKQNMYRAADYHANLFSVTIVLKDFVKLGCPYSVNIYHVNNKVDGVDAVIGNDGLILKDTTIPDLIISTINHKNKPDHLFKNLLDKHIQNIEAFKQKQSLNEELISTGAVYDGITYEINSFKGGRSTNLQIYRYKDKSNKKSHLNTGANRS